MGGFVIVSSFSLPIFLSIIFPCHVHTVNIAIDPGRAQLLKDALGWMTFRGSGKLLPTTEVESYFLDALYKRYSNSKAYRTFVIAFQQGVLHRLTLQENDACDPAYTMEFKNPHNYSVSWYYQKKFTFDYYDNRGRDSTKFCDYRQGLICKYNSGKCGCPEGSEMSALEPGSSVKRCLLKENEICSLIDLAHGNDPKHSALAKNLPEMIFNLEKPIGCQHGTQCRFKSTGISSTIPKCYPNGHSWDGGRDPDYGEECTIGLYASPGSCMVLSWSSDRYGQKEGYLCYNFGLPQSQGGLKPGQENRIGFCFHSLINYGISHRYFSSNYKPQIDPMFMQFVTPRTTPLRDRDLRTFTRKFLNARLTFGQRFVDYQVETEGASCSTVKTKAMEDVWQYFSSLEGTPPQGQDYVSGATQAELDKHLDLAIDQLHGSSSFCKVYWETRPWDYGGRQQVTSYKCVATGAPPDANGDDGECKSPGTLDTLPSAKKMGKFLEDFGTSEEDVDNEEEKVRHEILRDNPEAPCIPKLDMSARRLDALEGGECPPNSICIENYEDGQGIYEYDCSLKPGVQLRLDCQDTSGGAGNPGRCEEKMLNKKIFEEVEKTVLQAKLGRGDKCRYDWEKEIRDGIENGNRWNGNKYKMLATLLKENKNATGQLCDRTRLLECTEFGICKCVRNTEPRVVRLNSENSGFGSSGTVNLDPTDEEDLYQSDYCYQNFGGCKFFTDALKNLPLTQVEIDAIGLHYGHDFQYDCENSNACVFFEKEYYRCTTENTGYTGYDLKPRPITTTTTTTTTDKYKPLPPPKRYEARGGQEMFGSNGLGLTVSIAVLVLGKFISMH